MSLDFQQNFFELFGLPLDYRIDEQMLHDNHQKLQAAFHPDRYAAGSDQERRIAVQQASRINEAYDTLHNPVQRAQYMLKLAGIEINDQETTQDTTFLMEQIELREEMDQCRSCQDPMRCCDHITGKLDQRSDEYASQFESLYQQQKFDDAYKISRKMQFIERIGEQIDDYQLELEEQLL